MQINEINYEKINEKKKSKRNVDAIDEKIK